MQWSPPSALLLCTKIGLDCWMSGYYCRLALDESQPRTLYLASLGCYLSLCGPPALPHLLPAGCYLAIPSSSPPEPHLHICLNTSPQTVAESILCDQNLPKAARSQTSQQYLQPPSPSAGVYPVAVSQGYVPGWLMDASSSVTQPPILSATCWMYGSSAAPSFSQIASRSIPLSSSWLGLWLSPRTSPTNHHYHNLHRIRHKRYMVMGANP